jgi:hypothetical protein
MPTTITIDSVTTADKAPTVAPHKISNKTGKSTATFLFTPVHNGVYVAAPELVTPWTPGVASEDPRVHGARGWQQRVHRHHRWSQGARVQRESEPCSDSTLACTDWDSPSGTQLTGDVTYAETGAPADSTQRITVYVCTDRQGWS